jgi:hypothetical protein
VPARQLAAYDEGLPEPPARVKVREKNRAIEESRDRKLGVRIRESRTESICSKREERSEEVRKTLGFYTRTSGLQCSDYAS